MSDVAGSGAEAGSRRRELLRTTLLSCPGPGCRSALEGLLDLSTAARPDEAVRLLLSRVAGAAGAAPEDDAPVLRPERRPA